jgi:hypothetical protein
MHMPTGDTLAKLLHALAAVLSAIAWPSVAVTALVVLQKPIRAFFTDITEFGWGKGYARKGTVLLQQSVERTEASVTATISHASDVAGLPANAPPRLDLNPAARAVRDKLVASNIGQPNLPDKDERLMDALALAVTYQVFEVTFRSIFGSQLALVRRAAAGPVTFDEARAIFDQSGLGKKTPEFPFNRWLAFLTHQQQLLVRRDDENKQPLLDLTDHGRGFLAYLAENGIDQFRPF